MQKKLKPTRMWLTRRIKQELRRFYILRVCGSDGLE
jgi:hypothetical protein